MKKVVVVCMLIMSSWTLHAQWSLTPEAGITATNRVDYTNSPWRAGWKLGVGVEYQFNKLFALKSGLHYTQRGYSYSYYGMSHESYQEEDRFKYYFMDGSTNNHYFQIPVMAKFSWDLSNDVRMNVGVGPYMAFNLGENNEWSMFESDPQPGYGYAGYTGGYYGGYYGGYGFGYGGSYYSNRSDRNKFDWGMSLSVGLEVKNWVMNLGYDIALGKEYSWDAIDAKYHTIGLSVGYKFKLGK